MRLTKLSMVTLRALPMLLMSTAMVGAQLPGQDPSARLRELLPADVAERVLARIAEARSRELPPDAVAALENRALKFASRGVEPHAVERAIGDHADRMQRARVAIETARSERARGEEIDAGAEAMRQGVAGEAVSELARSAPSGRSLAVPLFVIGGLVERGLPADEALSRVRERLLARVPDTELERMPNEVTRGRPEGVGPGARPVPADRPTGTGRPTNVPATGGRPTIPTGPPAGPGRP